MALLAARFATTVVHTLRRQVDDLGRLQQAETDFGRKLQTLFSIMEGIGSALKLEQVLNTATAEVALVMQVKGSSVKLLTEDGKFLRYAAAFGLPELFVRDQVVEVARSPLNKRIIDGEPFVTGQVTAKEMFQFGEVLSEAQIQSVLFVPLHVEGRVMGILGAYCEKPARFSDRDVEFFRLAAGLVAIAIENARAYEAVKTVSNERNWFMMKVTHNLRAPLAGMLSILEVVREGYLGALNDEQSEYLRRLDRRARTMLSMINGLMALSRNRERTRLDPSATTAPEELARRVRRTFQDKAAEKRLAFQVNLPENLPPIRGPLETLEQLLENLVSNAIKYTTSGGRVDVTFTPAHHTVRLEVSDTGIGIPKEEELQTFSGVFPRGKRARRGEHRNGPGPGHREGDRGQARRPDHRGERTGTGYPVRGPSTGGTGRKGGAHMSNVKITPDDTPDLTPLDPILDEYRGQKEEPSSPCCSRAQKHLRLPAAVRSCGDYRGRSMRVPLSQDIRRGHVSTPSST